MAPYKNGTRQKLHLKYTNMTPTKILAKKNGTPCEKKYAQVTLFTKDWAKSFLKFLFFCMIQTYGHEILKLIFFHSEWYSYYSLVLNCFGSISRVLAVLQKTNDVVARCCLCWVLFLEGGMFDKRSGMFDKRTAPFVTLVHGCQWVP